MFRRTTPRDSNPGIRNLIVKVESFINLEGKADGPKDAVKGTRFDTGEPIVISLTTQGESAANARRNSIASFDKKSSNHHVEAGGLMQFNQLKTNGSEVDGVKHYLARWAEFFERDEAGVKANLHRGLAMYRAGTKSKDGVDTNWGFVERVGKPMAVPAGQLDAYVAKMAEQATASEASARPILRLIDSEGRISDFAVVEQRADKDEGTGKWVPHSPAQVVENMNKDQYVQGLLKAVEEGRGQIEIIPVLSNQMSKLLMNGARGAAMVAFSSVFNTEDHRYAVEALTRITRAENGVVYATNLGLLNGGRVDPLLIPSKDHAQPSYHPDLLAAMEQSASHSKPGNNAPAADPQAPAADPLDPQHEEDAYDDVPGFGNA
ncbi:hypothetical protein [Geopseudomonas aromaticivorans]